MAWNTGEDYEHKTSLSDWALIRRFWGFMAPHKKLLTLTIALSPIERLFPIFMALLVKQAIDHALPGKDFGALLKIGGLFALCMACESVLSYVSTVLNEQVGQRVTTEVRLKVLGHLLRQGHPFFDRNPIGKITTRVTNDVENLGNFFSMGAVSLLKDILTLAYVLITVLVLSPKLTVMLLPVLVGVYVVSDFFRRRLRQSSRQIRDAMSRINGYLQEHLGGAQTVQLFGQQRRVSQRFEEHNKDYLTAYLANIRDDSLLFALIEWGETVVIAVVMVFAAATLSGAALSLGMMVAFVQLLQQFFVPVRDLSQKFAVIQSALASLEKIYGVLDTDEEIKTPHPQPLPPSFAGGIAFEGVDFSYPGGERALKNLSLTIPHGQRVALVGHTGSGKSTLFKLLLRFYEPQQGAITLDGVPLNSVAPHNLYQAVGMVSQDIEIFEGTLLENLTLLESGLTREEVISRLKHFGAGEVFPHLFERLDQPVQAGGKNFSVGEKQLLSILRAMLRNPHVVLLDEATASVDAATEARIQAAMLRLFEGRTVLVIAHRLATVRSCHRLLVLHHGRLAEDGSHTDLLQRGGLYAKLHQLQFATGFI